MFSAFISTTKPVNKTSYLRKGCPSAASQDPVKYLKPCQNQNVGQNPNQSAIAKRLRKLVQIAYYQAGKIVIQTLLPQHPPIALISLNLSGLTTTTSADTYIPLDNTSNAQWCSFFESRLIGLYSGKATCSLLEGTNRKTSGTVAPIPSELAASQAPYGGMLVDTFSFGRPMPNKRRKKQPPTVRPSDIRVNKQATTGPELAINEARILPSEVACEAAVGGTVSTLATSKITDLSFTLTSSIKTNRNNKDQFGKVDDHFVISFYGVGNRINTVATVDNSIESISRTKIDWTEINTTKKEWNFTPPLQRSKPRLVLKTNPRLRRSFTNSKNGTRQAKIVKISRLSPPQKFISQRSVLPKLKIKKFFLEESLNGAATQPLDLGHLEIQLATRLATTMIHKWFFYSLQFLQYADLLSWCNKPFRIDLPPKISTSKNNFLKKRSVCLKKKTGGEIKESYINRIFATGITHNLSDKKPIASQLLNPNIKLISKKHEKLLVNHTVWSMVSTLSTPTLSMSSIMSTPHPTRDIKTHPKKIGLAIGSDKLANRVVKKNLGTVDTFSSNKTVGVTSPPSHLKVAKVTSNRLASPQPTFASESGEGGKPSSRVYSFVRSKINTIYNGPALPPTFQPCHLRHFQMRRWAGKRLPPLGWQPPSRAASRKKPTDFNNKFYFITTQIHETLSNNNLTSLPLTPEGACEAAEGGLPPSEGCQSCFAVQIVLNEEKKKLFLQKQCLSIRACFIPNKKGFTYSNQRISVENVGEKFFSQIDAFQLINPLQFSNAQRDRFYPSWFRLYLPDIEATEFMKNVANFYYSLGLQTLVRPSLAELILLTSSILPSTWSSKISFLPCQPTFASESGEGGLAGKPQFDQACQSAVLQYTDTLNNIGNICAGFTTSTLFCPVEFAFPKKEKLFDNLATLRSWQDIKPFNKDENSVVTHDPLLNKPFKNLRQSALPATFASEGGLVQQATISKADSKNTLVGTVQNQVGCFADQINNQVKNSVLTNLGSKSNLVNPENANSQDTAYSTTILQNTFFCYGNNDLSVGVGLLRNAAKRRNQLNKKSQHLYKLKATLKEVFYPIDSVRSLENAHIFLALWGFSRPWHISRFIHIGFKPALNSGNTPNKKLSKKLAKCLHTNTIKTQNIVAYQEALGNWQNKELFDLNRHKKQNNNGPALPPSPLSEAKVGWQPIVNEVEINNQIKLGRFVSQFSRKKVKQLAQSDVSSDLLLEKQIFPTSYSAISSCSNQEKELICHALVNNCFAKACLLVDQNRQVIDYFADYLIRFQTLRQHQILYIFSTVLLNCKKKI